MPINPLGEATYKGLAAPLFGDAVVEQENSSNYVRTYVHTSANTGGFLMGMDFRADKASSLLTDLALWDIDVDGGFRSLSGTTVNFELNSSGLYGTGGIQLVSAAGNVLNSFRTVTTVTTGTTAYAPTSTQSGSLFVFGVATSQGVVLPKNPTPGTWFEFYISSQAASTDFIITTTGDSSARIELNGVTSAVSTALYISPAVSSLGANSLSLVAVSSVLWLAKQYIGLSSAATTNFALNDFRGQWSLSEALT